MSNKLVFLQSRSTRGGAQVALARLLSAPAMHEMNPVVITSDRDGWLPKELSRLQVDYLIEQIPSSRSIFAKLIFNRSFANRVANKLGGNAPLAVIANNHNEAPLAYQIAERLGARSAVILRDPYLTKQALEKYDWDLPDHVLAVGAELAGLATSLSASVPVTQIYDAINDFAEPVEKPEKFPDKVLVVGSSHPRKGWRELIDGIEIAGSREPALKSVRFVFSGSAPDNHKSNEQMEFAGHTTEFFDRIRSFKLAINPSKAESFGLASLEVLAAGVPLISSYTGVMNYLIRLPTEWMLPDVAPEVIADRLIYLYRNWQSLPDPIQAAQETIRSLFTADHAAAPILASMVGKQRGE